MAVSFVETCDLQFDSVSSTLCRITLKLYPHLKCYPPLPGCERYVIRDPAAPFNGKHKAQNGELTLTAGSESHLPWDPP